MYIFSLKIIKGRLNLVYKLIFYKWKVFKWIFYSLKKKGSWTNDLNENSKLFKI